MAQANCNSDFKCTISKEISTHEIIDKLKSKTIANARTENEYRYPRQYFLWGTRF